MGKDLKGKELGKGISQRKDGLYTARFVNKNGKSVQKYFNKLQECRQWYADATYIDEHSDINNAENMIVDNWFEYWIDIKRKTVRPNTVRNYNERYQRNIKPIIGNMVLTDVKPIHCQNIFLQMAEEGYRTTTLYQTRIALYNLLEFAKENDIILNNPCKRTVKSNMGKPSQKKEALTLPVQKKFLEYSKGYSYDQAYRFILQTGLRTGELVALKWSDIDFENRTMNIQRSMEFRYSTGEWRIGEPKSKSGYRTIPLTQEAINILYEQKLKNSQIKVIKLEWKDYIFLCRDGTPTKNSTYDTGLFKTCDRAGIDRFSMHVLRHTFATRCIEGGMKPKTLQIILGHSNINITMNLYVHITDEEKNKEMSVLEEYLKIV